jgi:hypothetical protein
LEDEVAKKTWSRKSKFTAEERKKIARESLSEPDSVIVARYPWLKPKALANWRKRMGLKKPLAARGSTEPLSRKKKRGEVPGAKRREKAKATAANGHAAPSNGTPTIEGAIDDLVHAQEANARALASLRAVREAYLRVFGGG